MTKLDKEITAKLQSLIEKAESGEDWAEICRLAQDLYEEAEEAEMLEWVEIENNSQFGVGA